MPNNGFLVGDNCLPPNEYALSVCSSRSPATVYSGIFYKNGAYLQYIYCYDANMSTISSVYSPALAANCPVPGPDMTSQQQVEAVNALFPTAVALLAVAWGLRFVRRLIERAAFSRPGGDE